MATSLISLPYISTELLVDILLFITVFVIAKFATENLLKNSKVSILIGAVIALLTVTYTNWVQFDSISLAYGSTGLILLLVPFAAVFFFVYTTNIVGFVRKAIWIFYGIITWILWNSSETLATETVTLFLTIFTVLLIVLILFDTTIKNWMETRKNMHSIRRNP